MQVFPAHGAGSPCGKNLSSDLFSTVGKQRLTNSALTYSDVRLSLSLSLFHIIVCVLVYTLILMLFLSLYYTLNLSVGFPLV